MTNEDWQKVREIFDDALRQKHRRTPKIYRRCMRRRQEPARRSPVASCHPTTVRKVLWKRPLSPKVAVIIEAETNETRNRKMLSDTMNIIRQIGVGGIGRGSILPETRNSNRNVAIKFLNEEFSQDESNLKRFVSVSESRVSIESSQHFDDLRIR
jgi:hypothetical protein